MKKHVHIPGAIKVAQEYDDFMNGTQTEGEPLKSTKVFVYIGSRDEMISWLKSQGEQTVGRIELRT